MFKVDLPPDSSWKWETKESCPHEIEGHDQPCPYCGKLCNALAGNPGEWPVGFPEKDEPGKIKWHHIGCLLRRLDALEEAIDTMLFIKREGDGSAWKEATDWLDTWKDLYEE